MLYKFQFKYSDKKYSTFPFTKKKGHHKDKESFLKEYAACLLITKYPTLSIIVSSIN